MRCWCTKKVSYYTAQTFRDHMHTLQRVYACLTEKDLPFNVTKMKFDYPKAIFLGHMVDARGGYSTYLECSVLGGNEQKCGEAASVVTYDF